MKKIGFQIFGEPELQRHIKMRKPLYSHCISIRNPDNQHDTGFQSHFKEVLELRFYDVESADQLPNYYKDRSVPEPGDVRKAYGFFKRTSHDPECTGYVVHCWQGISRSTGIALGLLYSIVADEKKAVAALKMIRPMAAPHARIVQFWDQLFGSNLHEEACELRARRMDDMRAETLNAMAAVISS